MNNQAIGIFDSGVGGLTVFSEIRKQLPAEDLIYVGDTKRFPYGSKSKENIIQISRKIVDYLITRNVKMIVIACGTATSQALEELKKEYTIPIIGIISPTIEKKVHDTISKIGILATRGTIRSREWERQIHAKNEKIEVINVAAPLLAPIAEEGWTENEVASYAIKEYMSVLKEKQVDQLILGCTHYPLFKKLIKKELGEKVDIVNTGEQLASYLKDYIQTNNLFCDSTKWGKDEINLTDDECNFINVAELLLRKVVQVKKIVI